MVCQYQKNIFERDVHERLYKFVDKKKFYSKQFGLGSKLSSVHALSDITEMIRSNYNFKTFCILFDLQKIQICIFCTNLKHMASGGSTLIGSHQI